VAIGTLEAIARLRGRLTEVMTALNATANHGPLMFLLRKTLASLDLDGECLSRNQTSFVLTDFFPAPELPQDYVDAVFSLVSYLTTTQAGGPMITSSGIIPALVGVFSNNRPSQIRNVLKATGILDTIVYGFQNGFQILVTAGGVDLVISRVDAEAKFCVALADATPASASACENQASGSGDPMESAAPTPVAAAEDVAMGEAERPAAEEVDGEEAEAEAVKVDVSPALPINAHSEI
jgi:E3 ubiquitin-protein ligase HUWE1